MKLLITAIYSLTLLTGTLLLKDVDVAAMSENIVIHQVQTGGLGTGTSTQEIVILYNSSDVDINVTNWCIEYSSSSDNVGFNSCIEPPDTKTELWLSAKGFATFATAEFVSVNTALVADFVMSGGMATTSGHVRLFDSNDNEIDKLGWGAALSPEGFSAPAHISGQVMSRDINAEYIDSDINSADFSSQILISPIVSGVYEKEILVDLCLNISGLQTELPESYLADESSNCYKDFCPNLDGLQIVAPLGYEKPIGSDVCEEIPLEDRILFITELLPNPPSYDTNTEFIEIYNPNSEKIELAGYKIEVGPSYSKSFTFAGGFILPNEYLVFNDGITGIILPNTSGVKLRLVAPAGNVVSETEVYTNAGDSESWALVNDQWIYTNQITPDSANMPYIEQLTIDVEGQTTVYAPCPAGKYRSPETNRCRNIETALSQLQPCDEDEYRNPDTNRCRKIAASASTLKPCDEGEERNPETNRCRKISTLGVSSTDDLPTVSDSPVEQTSGTLNWSIIAVALIGTVGYMLYEWRSELGRALAKFK